jgi:hypothetical protein
MVFVHRNMEVIGIVGEGREDAWSRAMQPPRLLMQRVHIPFTFKLEENKPIGYNGEYNFIETNPTTCHPADFLCKIYSGIPPIDNEQ